jgi:peptidoglycan hydrolase-like protein with peptidoglycan-binding domain
MVTDGGNGKEIGAMRTKIATLLGAAVLALAILLAAAGGSGAAPPLTAADIDMLLTLGLISQEEASSAKDSLAKSLPVNPGTAGAVTVPPGKASSDKANESRWTFTRDLQTGSQGADVSALQRLLGVNPATGRFGALTKAAVIKYQIEKGIRPATGLVGPKTRALLNAAGSAPRP